MAHAAAAFISASDGVGSGYNCGYVGLNCKFKNSVKQASGIGTYTVARAHRLVKSRQSHGRSTKWTSTVVLLWLYSLFQMLMLHPTSSFRESERKFLTTKQKAKKDACGNEYFLSCAFHCWPLQTSTSIISSKACPHHLADAKVDARAHDGDRLVLRQRKEVHQERPGLVERVLKRQVKVVAGTGGSHRAGHRQFVKVVQVVVPG
jgi:hypothetical protein